MFLSTGIPGRRGPAGAWPVPNWCRARQTTGEWPALDVPDRRDPGRPGAKGGPWAPPGCRRPRRRVPRDAADRPRRGAPWAPRTAGAGQGREERSVSEAVCKPSSVPAACPRRGWPSIWGRRLPDGSCGRPEGWAAHLSPSRLPAGYALLFGLAPGGVCLVSLRPPARARGGIVTVALVLVSRRTGVTRHPALRSSDFPHAVQRGRPRRGARPSDGLADERSLPARFRVADGPIGSRRRQGPM